MPLQIVKGDICQVTEGYIVHQCNCVSLHCLGLSAHLAKAFPGTCPYQKRRGTHNLAIKRDRAIPGTINIAPSKQGPIIVNLFGQYGPGKPNEHYPADTKEFNDDASAREVYFQTGLECLAEYLINLNMPSKIAFPFKIGCGLAGGNWPTYLKLITDFAKMSDYFEVTIYQLE